MKEQKSKGKDTSVMHERTGKKGNGTLTKIPYGHKLGKEDIPTIMEGLRRYKPIVGIADYLDCPYSQLLKFIHEHPELSEAKHRAMEGRLDIAESKLMESIVEGNMNSIFYFLDRMGRNRGYGQHQEVEANVKESAPRIVIGTIGRERIEAAKKAAEEATKAAKAGMPDDEGAADGGAS